MRYSFNAWNNSLAFGGEPSLPAQIVAAAAAGYDDVGLDLGSIRVHEREGLPPAALGEILASEGIGCYELVPLPLSADVAATVAAAEALVAAAGPLGARTTLATVQGPLGDELVRATRLAAEILADAGLAIGVEFLPVRAVNSVATALALVEAAEHPGLGLCVDVWHLYRGPADPGELAALSCERIGFVQFSDAGPPVPGDLEDQYRNHRLLPGEGVLPLGEFCDAMLAKGFDGVVSVEVLSAAWHERDLGEFTTASLSATKAIWEDAQARAATPGSDGGRGRP